MIIFIILKDRRVAIVAYLFLLVHTISIDAQDCEKIYKYHHPIDFKPRSYIAHQRTSDINIDGKLDEKDWKDARSSELFVDIEGEIKALPERQTTVKILHDTDFIYIGAYLEEDHLWYSLMDDDAIIYHDDDFEVFIDADGDGRDYQEFEVNQFNALMDLWLLAPYRTKLPRNYIMDWDAKGIKTAVHLEGTVNDPSDLDSFWSVEMAIPIKHLGPKTSFWRVNFSRVDWLMKVVDNEYVKLPNEPERNWVWSPIGYVNMHMPELWGYLSFESDFKIPEIEQIKWSMWNTFYVLHQFKKENGQYPETTDCFEFADGISVELRTYGFSIIANGQNGEVWVLNESGVINKK